MGLDDPEGRLLYGLAVKESLSFKMPYLVVTHVLPEREDDDCPEPRNLGLIQERILIENMRKRISKFSKSKSLTNLSDKK